MEKQRTSNPKIFASNNKIKYFLLSILFSILFILTAFPTTTQARPADFDGTAENCMKWDSTKKKWVYDAPMGESGQDGITIPDTAINGTDTVGSLAPTYTYWAGDSNRCGVICYVIDLSTNKIDRTYTPFIMAKNYLDSNNDNWQNMVNSNLLRGKCKLCRIHSPSLLEWRFMVIQRSSSRSRPLNRGCNLSI